VFQSIIILSPKVSANHNSFTKCFSQSPA